MARARVVHSADAVTVVFAGDRRRPEPSQGIILFPGGCVEVGRCTDGSYWAHIALDRNEPGRIIDSRIDREIGPGRVEDLPDFEKINHIALRISKEVQS